MSELQKSAFLNAVKDYESKIKKYTKDDLKEFIKDQDIKIEELAEVLECSVDKIKSMRQGRMKIDPKLVYIMDNVIIRLTAK